MDEGKQKFIGGINFDELRAQRIQLYNTITVDLATARINEEMVFTGNYIYALEATDVDANLDIRFNELFRATINIKKGRGVRVPFYRFYITNTAQAGKTLTLAIGIEASDFEVFDVGKALGITGTVNVAQVGNLTRPAGSTQVCEDGICAAGTEVTLHTVTALKTLYITAGQISGLGAGGDLNNLNKLIITNAADVEQYALLVLSFYSPTAGPFEKDSVSNNWVPPIEVQAGWKVKLFRDAGTTTYGTFQGYEV